MKMANYILSVLLCNQTVIWSWAFNNPMALPNNEGLIFHVNGFKHNGFVKVIYDDGKDLFVIILLDNTSNELQRINDVYFDGLVDMIDATVERTSDYEDRVKRVCNN